MQRARLHPVNLDARLLCLAGIFLSCGASIAPAQSWWLEGGPAVRGGMSIRVGGSSYAQQLGLHDPSAAGPAAPPGIGSPTGYADRSYDNGYVKLDPGTGNATPPNDPNTTWNWGFSQPGQYNAAAQTLSFQKQGSAGYVSAMDRSLNEKDDILGAGLQLRGGVGLIKSDRWSVDVAAGFQGIWSASSTIRATPYRENVQRTIVTDTYDTSGIGAANFPVTGFQGTYLGPFDTPPVIPSPVLPNLPQSRSSAGSAVLSTSQTDVSLNVKPDLYQFSIGPQLGYEAGSRVKLSLRPTVSLNLVDVDVSRSEVFIQTPAGGSGTILRSWSNHAGELDVRLGLGITAGADADLGRDFYAGVFGGYEWVPDKVKLTVGPSTVSFDGSGYVVGAVVGKRF